jgi:hypothetical protein
LASAALQAARNVGGFVEHGDDHGRLGGVVGNPIPAGLHPSPAPPRNLWIGAGGGEAGGWIALDLPLGFLHGGDQPANRLGAPKIFVMLAEGANLARGPRRKADQRRCVSLRAGLAAFLASSRARLS